jgi:hypothetical protein
MCGVGETLIPNEIIEITRQILMQRHYVWIVTNGTLTKRFNQFANFPAELRKRLGFKMSFHYLELIEHGLLDCFFDNVKIVKNAHMSFSVEVTANDEAESHISEILELTKSKLGHYCHISLPRDEKDPDYTLMSKHSLEKFHRIWGVFDSPMLDFKVSTWMQKRKEYCYAGAWTYLLSLETGVLSTCYGQIYGQDFFDLSKPIRDIPVGHHCKQSHCFNGHAFLALGDVLEVKGITYTDIRNRVASDESNWLTPEMKAFCSQRLQEGNKIFSNREKMWLELRKPFFIRSDFKNKVIKRIKNICFKRKTRK